MEVKISVIIPTFNRVRIIGETLDSVQAQSFTNWECIVVDDGSDDKTDELMNSYISKDSRFKYLRRTPDRTKGASSCRNIGLEHAQGEYIQFLDSDDIISSSKLELQLNALESTDSIAIATCKWGFFKSSDTQLRVISNRPTYINTNNPLKLLEVYSWHSTYLAQHVFLVPRRVIEASGKWNEQLSYNDDGEFFARVISFCSKVIFVPEAEAYYRVGSAVNLSHLNTLGKVRSAIRSWKLIDKTIESKFGKPNHIYVQQAKYDIYNKIKDKYPGVVRENHEFFKTKTSTLKHLAIKVLSRLQLLYLKRRK